jgi:glycosyltransferase involved in cell wall biosynthesis
MEPEDMDAWLAAAEKLAADPALRARQGLAGRAFAEANFSMDTVGDRFEHVFEAALRNASKTALR